MILQWLDNVYDYQIGRVLQVSMMHIEMHKSEKKRMVITLFWCNASTRYCTHVGPIRLSVRFNMVIVYLERRGLIRKRWEKDWIFLWLFIRPSKRHFIPWSVILLFLRFNAVSVFVAKTQVEYQRQKNCIVL